MEFDVVEYLIAPTLFLPVVICLHLSGWNFNNHCCKMFRSCYKMSWSFLSVIVLNILISSANKNVSEFVISGKSFIYKTNSSGPKIEP